MYRVERGKVEEKERWNQAMKKTNVNREILLSKYYSFAVDHDIKHLNFVLSRYKFAAKMIENKKDINLLELGCNHGLGMQFFSQMGVCKKILGVDFDTEAVQWANKTFASENITFLEDDFLNKDYKGIFGGAVDVLISIDVIEHILPKRESDFLRTIDINLQPNGLAIIGTPNITMSPYASRESKKGHVNLFDQKRLYRLLSDKFHQVLLFGMNDEVIHTGFYPMCCYIMAVCVGKK